jgi:hypothetical protein
MQKQEESNHGRTSSLLRWKIYEYLLHCYFSISIHWKIFKKNLGEEERERWEETGPLHPLVTVLTTWEAGTEIIALRFCRMPRLAQGKDTET